jgi:D-serine deaminase-like pyridoxal phosphate-dependent protein
VLLAYQPVGPNVERLVQLVERFPGTTFSALADDPETIRALAQAAAGAGVTINLFLDLDVGMHRTGVAAGADAIERYRLISTLPGLRAAGLHAYDGHLHDTDLGTRTRLCDEAFESVKRTREDLARAGLPVPSVVAGGTPTFPIHARRTDVECSPGTAVFWDWNYTTNLPDMDFLPAVLVLTRIISKPGGNRLCLDLGHKAIASENPQPRVLLMELPETTAIGHSEEHLVLETNRAAQFSVGTPLYGMPWHICPTVALHNEAVVIDHARADGRWQVVGRARKLTI